ncbi:helix-turn-helix domain-containing protein [Alkalihalobacillus sp. TS-13]|uniref:helix-turn-helix domain-containing protein n=1 Tax=Alkalihalobacillus sp. TS-13 TaxID=2842455 RepID=UPI001C876D67|nr:helix-turn-helix transcriptional regulator [Alkalihalobacillus sp. TS-13]
MERKHLIELRRKQNLTQKELADRIGISTIYVRKLEKGVVNPGLQTMIKYEKYFQKNMKYLFPDLFFLTLMINNLSLTLFYTT